MQAAAVASATSRLSTICDDSIVPDRRDPPDYVMFPTVAAFGAWLAEHHATASELWVGYYKKGVARTAMTYPEAVEEALCHGWIDGQVRRIDDEIVANRYTPRRPTSNWSAINIAKVAELTAAGRMRPAGLRAFETRDRRRDATYRTSARRKRWRPSTQPPSLPIPRPRRTGRQRPRRIGGRPPTG